MRAAGHEVVHEVVVAGDRVEHTAHAALLVAPRDAFVTEIGVLSVFGAHRPPSIDVGVPGTPKPLAFRGGFRYKAQLFERGSCTRAVADGYRPFLLAAPRKANRWPAGGRLRELLLGGVHSGLVLRPV